MAVLVAMEGSTDLKGVRLAREAVDAMNRVGDEAGINCARIHQKDPAALKGGEASPITRSDWSNSASS